MIKDQDILKHSFHTSVREYIVCLVLFLTLYLISYLLICFLRVNIEDDQSYTGDESDFNVFRICTWICTLSIAVSVAAVLLIPLSIFGNEILLHYPESFYFKWLNGSLVRNLWNSVFLLNNVCIFLLLPFAYFLLESHEPCPLYWRSGLTLRIFEALVTCAFVIAYCNVTVHFLFYLTQTDGKQPVVGVDSVLWWYRRLPIIYSCLSLIGTCILLACTPVGLGKILSVVDQIVEKPKDVSKLKASLNRLCCCLVVNQRRLEYPRAFGYGRELGALVDSNVKSTLEAYAKVHQDVQAASGSRRWLCWIKYTAAVSTLSILLVFSVLLVTSNVIQLVTGFRRPPGNVEEFELGKSSLSYLGTAGAVIEVVITLFFMMTSVYGLYSIPLLRHLMPERRKTPMRKIVLNSAMILLLSSALPVLCKVLGISSFDLLGDYGKLDWLGNLGLLLAYNGLFTLLLGCSLSATIGAFIKQSYLERSAAANNIRRQSQVKRRRVTFDNGHIFVDQPFALSSKLL